MNVLHAHKVRSGAISASSGLTLLKWLAPLALTLAFMLPWWQISMVAPQYPQGLHVTTWFFAVTGDVGEVDELNHYIGFMPLANVAHLERGIAYAAAPLALFFLVAALWCKAKWARIFALPALTLPFVFVGDLAAWLYYAGHHLDPHAALSSSVAPWTPRLFGTGGVGQFVTSSTFEPGFYLALAAAVLTVVALRSRRET